MISMHTPHGHNLCLGLFGGFLPCVIAFSFVVVPQPDKNRPFQFQGYMAVLSIGRILFGIIQTAFLEGNGHFTAKEPHKKKKNPSKRNDL